MEHDYNKDPDENCIPKPAISDYSSMDLGEMLGQLLNGSGISNVHRYTDEEMVETFIAGYKAMQLIDEDVKPEVIEMAKNFIKKFKR